MLSNIVGHTVFIGIELVGLYALIQYIRVTRTEKLNKTEKTTKDVTSMDELIAREKQQMMYFGIAAPFVLTNLAMAYVLIFC